MNLQIELWNMRFETTCSKKNLGITERSGNFPFRVSSHDSSSHRANTDDRDSTKIKNRKKGEGGKVGNEGSFISNLRAIFIA